MPIVTEHAPGAFCWPELSTHGAPAAKEFYTSLFGWKAEDGEVSPGVIYTMLTLSGKNIGALYEMHADQAKLGIPPHWLQYVAVADVEETARRAKAAGGTGVMAPFDVFDIGRMTLFQDPTGASIAAWQAKKAIGAEIVDEVGTPAWRELATRDPEAASRFYSQVFGWSFDAREMGGFTYHYITLNGKQNGGMMPMDAAWGDIPSHWMTYFRVADCDESARRAGELGAKTLVPPTDIPNVGRFSCQQDPQGAPFSIIQMKA